MELIKPSLKPPYELLDVWTVVIPARQSNVVLNHLKSRVEEVHEIPHVKRFVPETEHDGIKHLRMIVCTVDTLPEIEDAERVVRGIIPEAVVERRQCCRYQAWTKPEAAEWSHRSGWPIMWRGNTAAVDPVLSASDVERAKRHLTRIADLARSVGEPQRNQPIVASLVDPASGEEVTTCWDERGSNPLNHSVMRVISRAAELERQKRSSTTTEKAYLCLNLEAYTTHEPCTMCSMALVHSRIARLFYIEPQESTGAIDPHSTGLCVHARKQLNWTYDAWRWTDPEVPGIEESVNA
ncbi:tRNA-specific adenosine deaminase subunit Tad3p [Trichomonascus vanleenenianus]|uniref:Tad3p n=1 Tax=Trichomonascus vanleenenianus TaxID=2268995 RepID=UPI003EC95EEF